MAVAVVGAGVVGLTTGVLLAQRGYEVTVYAAHVSPDPNVNSLAACAIWGPFLMSEPERHPVEVEAEQQECARWAQESWKRFSELPWKQCGVRKVTQIESFDSSPSELPYYKDIVEDFESMSFRLGRTGINHAWKYKTFVIEMPKYMAWLQHEATRLGIKTVVRKLARGTLGSLPEKVIFNCSGLGARDLTSDKSLIPIKGQLILSPPKPLLKTAVGDGYFCLIPRTDALVIGSLNLHEEARLEPSAEGESWLREQYAGWAKSPTGRRLRLPKDLSSKSTIVVGLRPFRRDGVRLERQENRDYVLYHNYGHGGGGVTFSWGCALSVAELYEHSVREKLDAAASPGARRRTCDVSIEIAHVSLEKVRTHSSEVADSIDASIRHARRVVRELGGKKYCVVVLVDDKRVSDSDRSKAISWLKNRLTGAGVDYLCFESQLVAAIPSLESRIPRRDRRPLVSAFQGKRILSCTEDIALWYSLRLGLANGLKRGQLDPLSEAARKRQRPFQANQLVSILPIQLHGVERRAQAKIQRAFGPEIASVCGHIYY